MKGTSPRVFPSMQSVPTLCIRQRDDRSVLVDQKRPNGFQRCAAAGVGRQTGCRQGGGLLYSVKLGPEEIWGSGNEDSSAADGKKGGGRCGGIRDPSTVDLIDMHPSLDMTAPPDAVTIY